MLLNSLLLKHGFRKYYKFIVVWLLLAISLITVKLNERKNYSYTRVLPYTLSQNDTLYLGLPYAATFTGSFTGWEWLTLIKKLKYFELSKIITFQGAIFQLNKSSLNIDSQSDLTFRFSSPIPKYFTKIQLIQREIPISNKLLLDFEKGYGLSGNIILNPLTATVKGPKAYIDKINYIYIKNDLPKKIISKFTKELSLNAPQYPFVTLYQTKVKAYVPVDHITTATINVPIQLINVPKSENVWIVNDNVTLTFNVAINNYPKIQPSSFHLIADYKQRYIEKLPVQLVKMPNWVSIIDYEPKYVNYLIYND